MPRFSKFLTSQRGAMFGMDARVALTIFGALAILGGYTMMGRIETAKTAKFIKELQTISHGLAAVQADLGIPVADPGAGVADPTIPADVFDLLRAPAASIPSLVNKWSGPYINEPYPEIHPVYGAWTTYPAGADPSDACAYPAPCFVWMQLDNFPEKTFNEINAVIDENGGTSPEADAMNEGRVMFKGSGNGVFMYRAIGWDPLHGRTVE